MKKLTLFLILSGLFVIPLKAQEKKSRKEKKQEKKEAGFTVIDSLIDGKVYRFDAKKANPAGGGQIDLTTHSADLIIKNDSVESYLPFFGRAYNVSYGGSDSGIKFETILIDYKVEKNKDKLMFNISFSAKTDNEKYQCNLTVFSSGSATLSVTSINKAHISFNGTVVPIKKE